MCTKKDKLHNDLVAFLVDENEKFQTVEVALAVKNFVKTIVECLYTVCGWSPREDERTVSS